MRTQTVQAYLANNPVCFDLIILQELTEVCIYIHFHLLHPFSIPLYAFIAQKILNPQQRRKTVTKIHPQLKRGAPTATSSRTTEALPRPAARRKASPMSAAATPSATNCRTSERYTVNSPPLQNWGGFRLKTILLGFARQTLNRYHFQERCNRSIVILDLASLKNKNRSASL